jgi:hypothetical protein
MMYEVRVAVACGPADAAGMKRLWVVVVANGPLGSGKVKAQAHPT